MSKQHGSLLAGCFVVLLLVALAPRQLDADHLWGGYHFDGESLPVDLEVGDNLTTEWDAHLDQAVDDWNHPTGGATPSVNLSIGSGSTDPATCEPTIGRVEVCNSEYGANGWLGLAQVWVYRGKGKHIAQATALMNDTYFNTAEYDSWAWRQMVVCQEIAHDFGLDHQDEEFNNANLGTCMDYTSNPTAVSPFNGKDNTSPNQHDFDQLADLYAHIGGGGSGGGGRGGGGGGGRGNSQQAQFPDLPRQALERVPTESPAAWGQLIRVNGRYALYALDRGNVIVFTHVTWAS